MPDPTVMDHTPTQLCQPQGNLHHHEKVLRFPAGNLISVPISYGLDKEEINEGHVNRRTPTDNSRSFAWDTGTNGNNMKTDDGFEVLVYVFVEPRGSIIGLSLRVAKKVIGVTFLKCIICSIKRTMININQMAGYPSCFPRTSWLDRVGDILGRAMVIMPMVMSMNIRHEIVGVVTEVGSKVQKFKVGDKVGIGCLVGACLSAALTTFH
ncbi:hypothetical protein SO802_010231 [Lithocarpus litseifolius]|uniref:Alcohol dehydrogenase-like N-terminal domain-containing protein n=1 Tax=Lithocarpus litseifolius TaxID=425828 RepID=A0AAW2DEV5_9ROSI